MGWCRTGDRRRMPIELELMKDLAGQAVAGILEALPTVRGAAREALLEALNALDDIEVLAEAALGDADAGDDAMAPEVLGENVEQLALWRGRPVPEAPAAAADGQQGALRAGALQALEGGFRPLRLGA